MTAGPMPERTAAAPRLVGPREGDGAAPSPQATDPRVRAAARVLAGEDLSVVALQCGASPEQVRRWVRGLSEGGARAVAGVGLSRPAVTAAAHVGVAAPVEEYLAVVAHELRTPLTAARAGLAVLAREHLDPRLRAHTAEMVRARLDELEQLARDVSDAVGVSTGHIPLHPGVIDLADVVSEACVHVGVTPPEVTPPAEVRADPDRVCQMVARLLAHTLRYGGPTAVSPRVQSVPDGVLLTLRCAGVALTTHDATALLEPFSSAAHGDGNGLALYVVRTLAVASGGQLGVAGSAPGAPPSTVFWLLLPAT